MNEKQVTERIPLVIVGGGLSGLALSSECFRRGINHVVLEASPLGKNQTIHYLTSRKSAESLGLSRAYDSKKQVRKPVTGYTLLDGQQKELVALESLPPNENSRDGFVTFSIAEIRDSFTSQGLPIRRGQRVKEITRSNDSLHIETTKGNSYDTQVIVDATGASASVLQLTDTADKSLIQNRRVRYCYGGVFNYDGPEDQMLFVDRFPSPKGGAKESAGWVMPLGDHKAEVVVGYEDKLGKLQDWRRENVQQLLTSYIDWFNARGIPINISDKTEIVSGFFSEELLDYRKLKLQSGIVAFGESAGLNHPLNGYLIRNIADYARIMSSEIQQYLETGQWKPYKRLIGESSVNFGLQQAILERKMKANTTEKGRSSVTKRWQQLVVKSLGEDSYWKLIDEGLPLAQIAVGLIKHPQYIPDIISLGFNYLKVLFSKNLLYVDELKLKLSANLRKKRDHK